MTAQIGYNSIQNDSQLIASIVSNNPGDPAYPVDNLLDYKTHTVHQFAVAATVGFDFTLNSDFLVNYVGFAGHTIPSGSEVRIINPSNGAVLRTVYTDGTGPQMLIFLFLQRSTYRVEIDTGGAQVVIGSFFAGARMELPQGLMAPYTPPPLAREVDVYPNVAQKGATFMGTHIQRRGWPFTIEQQHLTPAWVDENWWPLVRHMERWPFFYMWDDQQLDHTVYGWIDGKMNYPRYTSPIHMAFKLKCRGLHVA